MALLLLSFVAGLLTVLAPCVLPLLPVIVGGSVTGERSSRRALIISLSLGASVFLFTILLKASTTFIAVPQIVWQIISGGLLSIFGLVTLFPILWDKFSPAGALNRESNKLLATGYTRKNIFGDIIMGAALGPVFSSCSPTYFIVLATVLPAHPAMGALYILVYSIGLTLALFGISLAGQALVLKLGVASDPNSILRRTIGAIILIIGLAVITGYDKIVESDILSHAGIFDVTQIEQNLLGAQGGGGIPPTPLTATSTSSSSLSLVQKSLKYPLAPKLVHPDAYLNTTDSTGSPQAGSGQATPISLAQYKGKNVVLIDFWTYSCINCLRTLPYLEAWYDKYKDQGLVIIGVHTPEFAFEHLQANVQDALQRLGIKYPVVLDNEYATWNAFSNQYWPREYLIDIDGYIVHDHAGEGEYDVTEKAIQAALAERASRLGVTSTVPASIVPIQEQDLSGVQSPETYFGSSRNEFLANGTPGTAGTQTLTIPTNIQPSALYLGGAWDFSPEYATAQDGATITYTYRASDIYFVASAPQGVTIDVLRDGKPVGTFAGADVDPKTSTATIKEDRLYKLIHDTSAGVHTIQIKVHGSGLKAFTFTFG